MNALRTREVFQGLRLLSFGLGEIAPKGWFAESETFKAPAPDLWDPLAEARPDGNFDVIACSHALEYVPDVNQTLVALGRLLSTNGFMYLAYMNPTTNEKTHEWDRPEPSQAGRYRTLGRDYERWFERLIPEAIAMRIYARDAATDSINVCYVLTKNPAWMRRTFASELDVTILGIG